MQHLVVVSASVAVLCGKTLPVQILCNINVDVATLLVPKTQKEGSRRLEKETKMSKMTD